ncbi:MAG: HD domain-containing protein [Pseudobutyrivibrio sp.]|nr:HD domain-containing protein [Pseudobutyrivibrio sp.]
MRYKDIKNNEEVKVLIEKGNENLGTLGYTDHSEIHAIIVAEIAARILEELGYKKKQIELAKIAAFMHDIGNAINRKHHAEYGALLANDILKETDMERQDRLTVVSAIAHHDESTGGATDVVSAALIIADKTDVRRDRVRKKPKASFDIHDRVNYAVTETKLDIDDKKKQITLSLEIDEKICTMYEYFDIFLGRMMMCRKASELLGVSFRLMVNGNKAL